MLYTKNKLFKRILVALGVASLLGGIAELGIAYKAQNNQSQDAQNASSSLKPDYRLRVSQLKDTQAFKNEQLDGMTYPSTYSTVFMAYLTPDDVKSIAQYGQNNGYNRYIIWTLQGDMSPDSDRSLISAVNNAYQDNDDQKPHITSYWTNWSVYSSQHALKAKPYPIPGSYAKNKQGQVKVDNQDMANKLDHIDTLSYAFLEAQNIKKANLVSHLIQVCCILMIRGVIYPQTTMMVSVVITNLCVVLLVVIQAKNMEKML